MQHRERRGRAALELALAYNAKLPGPAARLPLQDGVSRVASAPAPGVRAVTARGIEPARGRTLRSCQSSLC
jgi:hypothetical protein